MSRARRKDRTTEDIYRLGFREAFIRSKGRPFIKYLNWYTGFGKTHNASVFAIELLLDCGVIPVFIAPLQSLVSGFEAQVQAQARATDYADSIEALVKQSKTPVTVHRLYSREFHTEDRSFFDSCVRLADWLGSRSDICRSMERDRRQPGASTMEDAVRDMRKHAALCLKTPVHLLRPTDDSYDDELAAFKKRANTALTAATRLTKRLIQLDIEARSDLRPEPTLMAQAAVADMVRRLFPLQAFFDTPGIIVSTASKARMGQEVLVRLAGEKPKWEKFETLPIFLKALNEPDTPVAKRLGKPLGQRVITFVDEEEDAYWFLFKERKSVLNAEGRNDLNSVITEFFTLLDLKWPRAFEHHSVDLARKVFEHLESIAESSPEVDRKCKEELLRRKTLHLPDSFRVSTLQKELATVSRGRAADVFSNEECLQVLRKLIDQNDAHNRFRRFRDKARVLARFRDEYFKPLARLFSTDAYALYRRVTDLVVDKKYFTMSRASYGEVLDQPGQTFFSQTANIMSTAFLRQVELAPETAGQTIRLVYHEQTPAPDALTLLDYLNFVLLIAKVLNPEGEAEIRIPSEEGDRYTSLMRFRREVRSLFKSATTEEALQQHTESSDLLTEEFFFKGTKSVVTLEESARQADEYNLPADVNLTVTITSLRATPEEDICDALGRSNGVYLMSATGGLAGAASGAFNMAQLQRALAERGGYAAPMTDDELAVVRAAAEERLVKRPRDVVILDDEEPAKGFKVSSGYTGLLHAFMDAYKARESSAFSYLNSYKRQEIAGLVASLDAALSTPLRSGLVLCQTVGRVQKALMALAVDRTGLVKRVDHDGHIFEVDPTAFPPSSPYRLCDRPVRIVLYRAPRFRRKGQMPSQEADDDGQFSSELNEQLDISKHKLLLWTGYLSAARGMNFITRDQGRERDFELFCLLNDPYYNRHTRPKSRGFSMETFQSFLQVLREQEPEWGAMCKEDVLFDYARNRWNQLRKEHDIDITRTVFQALGRSERTSGAGTRQKILLSGDAAQTVHLGIQAAPELVQRASPTQTAVLHAISIYNAEHALFESEDERARQARESLRDALAFRQFTDSLPKRFREDSIARTTWEALFDRRMFTQPEAYIEQLRRKGVPRSFVDAVYFHAKPTAKLFLKEARYAGLSAEVITDAYDGTQEYDWVGRIVSFGLVEALSERAGSLLKAAGKWEVQTAAGARRLVPQPWFVSEIMKGYIAEEEFIGFVEREFNVRPFEMHPVTNEMAYIDVLKHEKAAQLYQLYDFYLESGRTLFAIDMKNWARSTDRLKKEELRADAVRKIARLREALPGQRVKAVYINLHGAQKFVVDGDVHFMSLYVQATRAANGAWMPNSNLARLLLG